TYVMELFIATIFLCALPLAAVLNQRDRLAEKTALHLAHIRGISDRIHEVLFRIEDDGSWAFLSPAYHEVTGRDVSASLGRPMLAELAVEDHARILAALDDLRAEKIATFNITTTMVTAEGSKRYIEFDMFRTIVASGIGPGVSGIFSDVTARVLLDKQLQKSARDARRAAQRSEIAARTDELTGLPNRRAFFERIDESVAQGRSLALAVFDVDHFKRINDGYGHPAGDEVLRRIATTASAHLRENDMVARIGGEEFAIVFDGLEPAAAVAVAERVVAAVAGATFTLPGTLAGTDHDVDLSVTISMGLAEHRAGIDASQLLADADRALYAAKDGGRNQLRL
ncbi:MAG: GGDEF domain-containing protein, partial [Sphingomonadales bacterium]